MADSYSFCDIKAFPSAFKASALALESPADAGELEAVGTVVVLDDPALGADSVLEDEEGEGAEFDPDLALVLR